MATLKVVREAVRREDGDYVVTLKAPGKPENTEHPFMGPLDKAMNHMMAIRQLMLDQRMSVYEADQAVLAVKSHDGKGRKFQPSHLR